MITYALSDEEKETENIDDGIVEVTIAHVPEESMGLIATTLAAYIFFGYAMKLILEELEWFIEMRHKFLKKPKARNCKLCPTDSLFCLFVTGQCRRLTFTCDYFRLRLYSQHSLQVPQ